MGSIGYSAFCLLSFAIGTLAVAFAQAPQSAHIPPRSRVVIARMDGFETYFAVRFREKKVPISFTLDSDSTQYLIVGMARVCLWACRKCRLEPEQRKLYIRLCGELHPKSRSEHYAF